MPYDEAFSYACELIAAKYGVARKTLEAMGVYPTFYEYPYMDEETEWDFYITPRRDCDIQLDHEYPAEGEYRVVFKAKTGDVILCVLYLPEGEIEEEEEPESVGETWDFPISMDEAKQIAKEAICKERALNLERYAQYFEEPVVSAWYEGEGYQINAEIKQNEVYGFWADWLYINEATGEVTDYQLSSLELDIFSE